MKLIEAECVHVALPAACQLMSDQGEKRGSRNGSVLVLPEPLTTVYTCPEDRVLLWEERNANPFFHLMEALWMLSGRKDVDFVAKYAKQMREYSDDGITLNGAYGHRWRKHFNGRDQLSVIIEALARDPYDRRQVLSMWDGWGDPRAVEAGTKDVPCNLNALFNAGGGELDMTVFCRSNDLIWGCYGANAVHFSVLQEYLAAGIGIPIGTYTQISNNAHVYERHWNLMYAMADLSSDGYDYPENPYNRKVNSTPIVDLPLAEWDDELLIFMCGGVCQKSHFFKTIAEPMREMWETREPKWHADTDPKSDWKVACEGWLAQRADTKAAKDAPNEFPKIELPK
jgi:thymidylate synthase